MTPSTPLARLRLIGKLCWLGAWIIAAAGLIAIVLYIAVTFYNNQGNPGQDPNGQLTNYMIALLLAIPLFFFFLVLAAMGALLEYVGREQKPQEAEDERDDERVEITSLSDVP